MKRLLLSLPLVISFIGSFSYAEEYKSVADTINHYKEQTVTVKDLDEDARQFFTESYKGKDPGIIRADFNGDGKEDVAILTKGALLFFICTERCKEVKSQNYGGFAGFQYIIRYTKGS